MKKLLFIPAILLAGICFGQNLALPYDTTTGRINYKQITELTSSSQQAVYSNVLRWLDKKYQPLVDSIVLMDKNSGKITIRATLTEALRLPDRGESYLEHLITIDTRDNKCRMQVTELRFKEYFDETEYTPAGWKDVPIEGIILGLKQDKFGGPNAIAYKKYLFAEDICIKAILQSLDQFLLQNDVPANTHAAISE